MRLLAVRLQNLNSLSGTHEVRFDEAPLSAAAVFLITGPTGAGKSTLLDAMTLALYGRAARYGNEKADEMMSRHTSECLAEVEFETNGRRLRATWRLGKTKTGNLRPVQRTLADAVSGEILADKGREMDPMIESLTGLDAQRFLRSVLLAQGQFAAFLKAKPNERAELLEKITGTEIYRDLSALAFETHKSKEETARLLKERLGAVTVLDDDARAALEKSLAEAHTTSTKLNTEHAAATAQLNAHREHVRIVSELATLADAALRLQKAQTEAAAEVTKAKVALDDAKQQRAKREPVWDRAAGLTAKSEQFVTQLNESRDVYAKCAKEQKAASARREAAEKAFAVHVEAAQALEVWIKENADDAELGDKLPTLRAAVREWRDAHEKLTDARKRHAESTSLKQRLADSERQAAALAKQGKETATKIEAERIALEKLAAKVEAQREAARNAERVADFDEHRQDLKDGEPCPLCGATEHPFAHGQVSAGSQLQSARKLLASFEKDHTQANRALVALQRDLDKTEADLKGEKKRIDELQKAFAEIVVPDVGALETEEARARGSIGFLACARGDGEESQARKPMLQDVERELDAIEKRAAVFSKKQQEAANQRSERQKLEGGIMLAKQEETAKSKRLDELKSEGVELRKKADALKAQLNELLGGKSLAEDRRHHEGRLASAEKASREAESNLNTVSSDLKVTKAKQEQLEERSQPFAGQPVPTEEALAELEAKARQLNDAFAAKRTELGSLEQQLKSDDDARKRLEAGGAELQAAEAEALRWGRLKELIGSADGAKFARFAQSLTLRQLITLANEHLKVLAERYRLMAAPGEDLDLRIVDLYQANVDRPMESLSGGESFLASLALALGLSELASRHHPIDSLFIDEGFGTLDSETLEIALSALENLRSRGKTIGLISHVDLLKERLTIQVRVIRGAGGTSRIEVAA